VKPTAIDVLHKPIGLLGQQSGPAWTRIGLRPYAVEAIAVAPHGGQTMLLGAEASGVRKSVDGGITWSGSHTGLTNLAVQGFAFDVSAVATVYTATAGGGLFRSDGAGATWQNLAPGLIASVVKNIDSGSTWTTIFSTPAVIFNITIHPTNAGVLYAQALRWPRIVAVDTHLDRISCDRAQLGRSAQKRRDDASPAHSMAVGKNNHHAHWPLFAAVSARTEGGTTTACTEAGCLDP
jgi:hypothetical protein